MKVHPYESRLVAAGIRLLAYTTANDRKQIEALHTLANNIEAHDFIEALPIMHKLLESLEKTVPAVLTGLREKVTVKKDDNHQSNQSPNE